MESARLFLIALMIVHSMSSELSFTEELTLEQTSEQTTIAEVNSTTSLTTTTTEARLILLPGSICPDACSCQERTTGTPYLRCTFRELSEVPTADIRNYWLKFGGIRLHDLNLGYNKLEVITGGALANLRVRRISLSNNPLVMITPDVFAGVTGLESLVLTSTKLIVTPGYFLSAINSQMFSLAMNSIDSEVYRNITSDIFTNLYLTTVELSYCGIYNIEDTAFLSVKHLDKIILRKNQLTEIPKALHHLKSLQELDLRENQISSVDSDAFIGLDNIGQIYLAENNISHISADAFLPLRNALHNIDLSHNPLGSLPDKIFEGLRLKVLRLNSCKLIALSSNIFEDSRETLTTLGLDGNPIDFDMSKEAFVGLSDLVGISLSSVGIQNIPTEALSKMNFIYYLALEGNSISYLDSSSLAGMKVRSLTLTNNRITHIHPDTFTAHSDLSDIFLEDNRIDNVCFLGAISNGASIEIEGNPINCTCELYSFIYSFHDKENVHIGNCFPTYYYQTVQEVLDDYAVNCTLQKLTNPMDSPICIDYYTRYTNCACALADIHAIVMILLSVYIIF